MPGKCCLTPIVTNMITGITEEIANLSLTASFPAVAEILLGATADYLNTISGGLEEYAGGAFSYLLADIMSAVEHNTPDKIFEIIGTTGNGLLSIIDIMLNAKTELMIAAAYYTAVELEEELIKFRDLLKDIQRLAEQIRDELSVIDAPVQYKEFVKQDILTSIGNLATIDSSIDKIIKSPGAIQTYQVKILRDQINTLCDNLCNRPLKGPEPEFPSLNDIFGGNWSEIWENFKNKFTTCYKLSKELVKKAAELYLTATIIDTLVYTLLAIDLKESKATPYYTSYKKALLIRIKEMKQALEREIVNTDPTTSLYKWPEWCTEALMLKTLFQTVFPEEDKILESHGEAEAKYYQIIQAQENLQKVHSLDITVIKTHLISLEYYTGYAFSNGINDIQRGFVNNIIHKTQAECRKLRDTALRIEAAIQPILTPPYESPLFVTVKTLLETLGADAGLQWLKQGDINKLKDGIARWSATGGLSLTLAGQMVNCLTPLLNNSKLDIKELQNITNLMQSAMQKARSLKVNIPIPSLNLPLNIDPSSFLKYKQKLQEQLETMSKAKNLLDRIAQKVASDLYKCD